jgi:alkanesulfonate monooxygenase SsuD/methylene tetrahydromethanopterin reductase-like flavin-dependent oxidoreductase (luciferase family)
VEFGIFIQGYNPAFRREGNPDAEHEVFHKEMELVKAADAAGFKYVWVTEHHFLDEYSHLSANDVVLGYLACCTKRIHLGSGIFNPLPQVNHPAKVAEKVAMIDLLSDGRMEFGTGRGAGSHEILGFLPGMEDLSGTREIWEDVIREFPKMWMQDTYEGYEGRYWSLPPRKVLPKPLAKPHPPMWYAAGNTASYAMAARYGLGVLGFSVSTLDDLSRVIDAYKSEIPTAEPIGAFVNDNVMVTSAAFVSEDPDDLAQRIAAARVTYQQSNVFRYHDTFPRPAHVPPWPELLPDMDAATVTMAMGAPGSLIGTPEQALQGARDWEAAGADQLVFGMGLVDAEVDFETIRLLGEHVIPKVDTDPVHRTTRLRQAALRV